MQNLINYQKTVGNSQIICYTYNQQDFIKVIKNLTGSKTFQKCKTRKINHRSSDVNTKFCNCSDIIQFIVDYYRHDVQRFAQLFVPIILYDYQFKIKEYLICELVKLHSNLLKSRKDIFIEDFEESLLLRKYCQKSTKQFDHNKCLINSNTKDCRIKSEDIHLLKEIVKEFYKNNYCSNKAKCPCKHSCKYCDSDDIMLENDVNLCGNNSNNCNNSDSQDSCDDSKSNSETVNLYDNLFINSQRKNNIESTGQQTNYSNNQSISHQPSMRSNSRFSNHPKSILTHRNAGFVPNPRQAANYDNYVPSTKFLYNYPTKNVSVMPTRITDNGYSQFPRYSNTAQSKFNKMKVSSRVPFNDPNLIMNDLSQRESEVVINDECHDLENVDTITVKNSEGELRTYVDYNKLQGFIKSNRPINNRNCSRKVSFLPPNKNKSLSKVSYCNGDNYANEKLDCEPHTLTKAVLSQEANSMQTVVSLLNRKMERDELNNCLRLSVRAEHVIRKPDSCTDLVDSEVNDDFLTVSSEVQAQWENLNCDEELPEKLVEEFDISSPNSSCDKPNSHFSMKSKNSNRYSNAISDINTENIITNASALCDQAIQTDKFIYLENNHERLVVSPTFKCDSNKYNDNSRPSQVANRFSQPKSVNINPLTNKLYYEENDNPFYYYEDPSKRIIYTPMPLCFDHKQTQTSTHHNSQFEPNQLTNISYYPYTRRSHPFQTVHSYFRDPESIENQFLSNQFYSSQLEDPRFKYSLSTLSNQQMPNSLYKPQSTTNSSFRPMPSMNVSYKPQTSMKITSQNPLHSEQEMINSLRQHQVGFANELDNISVGQGLESNSQISMYPENASTSNNNYYFNHKQNNDYFFIESQPTENSTVLTSNNNRTDIRDCNESQQSKINCRCCHQNNNHMRFSKQNNNSNIDFTKLDTTKNNQDTYYEDKQEENRAEKLNLLIKNIEIESMKDCIRKVNTQYSSKKSKSTIVQKKYNNKPKFKSLVNFNYKNNTSELKHVIKNCCNNSFKRHINSVRTSNNFHSDLKLNPYLYLTAHQTTVLRTYCSMIKMLNDKTNQYFNFSKKMAKLKNRKLKKKITMQVRKKKRKNPNTPKFQKASSEMWLYQDFDFILEISNISFAQPVIFSDKLNRSLISEANV